jgi:hypothetical protein
MSLDNQSGLVLIEIPFSSLRWRAQPEQIELPEGQILWRDGDLPDGLYAIAAGVMRATYTWDNADSVSESIRLAYVAGCGVG